MPITTNAVSKTLRSTLLFVFIGLMPIPVFSSEPIAYSGSGWIETIQGYPVVHLKGTEQEMGYQFGFLAGDLVKKNIDNLKSIGEKEAGTFIKYIPGFIFKGLRRTIGRVFWMKFSDDVKSHINGIVEGANARPDRIRLHRMDIAFVNSLIDLSGIVNALGEKIKGKPSKIDLARFFLLPPIDTNCDTFAAWGPRTQGGKTFQTRNTDISTGHGMENYPVIIVSKKDGKLPVVGQSIAGIVGLISGMNSSGVGLGQVWTYSSEIKLQMPWQLQLRDVFMNARTAREAVILFAQMGKTAYGSNFVFADAGDGLDGARSEAFAVETTAKQFAVFEPNDPRELNAKWNGEVYGLPLPYAVVRGDVCMDPGIRAKQSASAGPTGDPRTTSAYQERYLGQVSRILAYQKAGILIGKDQAIAISKETAMKNSNLMNAVYANTDRDMWFTYSKINADGTVTQAYQRDYVNIPFYRYLETLNLNSEVISIKTYLSKKRNLKVTLTRQKKTISESTILQSEQQNLDSIDVKLGVKIIKGDEVELYDADTSELIDRLLVQNSLG